MAEFFDYNSDNGVWYEFDFDHSNGKSIIHTMQDVEPVLDYTAKMRNQANMDKGIKNGMWHYATIPATVQLELRQKGISLTKHSDRNRLLKELDQNYPHLKLTRKQHRISH